MPSSRISYQKIQPIPSELWTPLGMVPIFKTEGLAGDDGQRACGMWLNDQREVKIREGMNPVAEWQTVGHELSHIVLHDAGVNLKTRQEEAVCDAWGSYLAAFVLTGSRFPFVVK